MTELTVICGACHEPISPGGGFLGVRDADIGRYQSAEAAWREMHPGSLHSGADLMELPGAVTWVAYHFDCDPKPDEHGYQIDTEEITTWPQLTSWTAHLMGKTWLSWTDWDELLRETAAGTGQRIAVRTLKVA
jgi:hypothetical protein